MNQNTIRIIFIMLLPFQLEENKELWTLDKFIEMLLALSLYEDRILYQTIIALILTKMPRTCKILYFTMHYAVPSSLRRKLYSVIAFIL